MAGWFGNFLGIFVIFGMRLVATNFNDFAKRSILLVAERPDHEFVNVSRHRIYGCGMKPSDRFETTPISKASLLGWNDVFRTADSDSPTQNGIDLALESRPNESRPNAFGSSHRPAFKPIDFL